DPPLGAGALGRNRSGRRLHLRHKLAEHLRLEHEVEIDGPAEKQSDQNGGNQKSLDHRAVFGSRPRADASPPGPTLAIGDGKNAPPKWGRGSFGFCKRTSLACFRRVPPLSFAACRWRK